jgi:hypothetical protein
VDGGPGWSRTAFGTDMPRAGSATAARPEPEMGTAKGTCTMMPRTYRTRSMQLTAP